MTLTDRLEELRTTLQGIINAYRKNTQLHAQETIDILGEAKARIEFLEKALNQAVIHGEFKLLHESSETSYDKVCVPGSFPWAIQCTPELAQWLREQEAKRDA